MTFSGRHAKACYILIGEKKPRERTLSDAEIAALWQACGVLGYPYGPLFRLLLLTGARKAEVSDASWPEFDAGRKIWTVPAERFKSGRAHVVPCRVRR
jgi:integrase